MKTYSRLLIPVLLIPFAFGLYSCDKKNSIDKSAGGMAEFSFNLSSEAKAARSAMDDTSQTSYELMISVEDMAGNPVLTDKIIPVYIFGSGFISDKVEIKSGEYNLTKFMVIDASGQVIYASPMEGSPLAYITNDPLPVYFIINPDQVTNVVPEVLAVGDHSPGDFGYASFGMQVINLLEFYAICYLNYFDNPMIMAPIQITSARLTIYSNDGWYHSFDLKAELNKVIIRGGSDFYTLVIEKEGYATQTIRISAGELKNATQQNPLIIKINSGLQYKILELQPGPEEGKDAMISNLDPDKNFGDYKYFETTFITEPVLTVMRSNRSLIWFNTDSLPKSAAIQKVTLRLTYDLPIPFDSTYILNTDPSNGVVLYGAVLQQIIEPWDEHKVTWNNQPKTTEANQAFIYPFILNTNVIDVDVTGLFVNPNASVLPGYGMLFRLWPEDMFPGFRFVSSDYAEGYMRPKLIIYYTL